MRHLPAWLGGLLLSTSLSAASPVPDVKEFKLKNGLKLIYLKDSSIPNANMYTFWRVGSRNELPGITGLSHFFEHMMFNGSKNFPPGSFDKVMEAAGGANNAYTSNDLTVYTNWFPSSAFPTIVDLEADRIGALQLDDKMINSERGVVLSERSTGLENDPFEELRQTVSAVAFQAHPYKWPVIGWESDIKAWTKDDLQRYFDTYYNPANAVMVIVGDLDEKQVLAELQKKLEPIARPAHIPAIRTVEPEQKGERKVWVLKETASSAHLLLTYHIPNSRSADMPALTLLGTLLTDGPSSRLYKPLVDQKSLALSVGAYPGIGLDPELFTVALVGTEGKKPSVLLKALDQELDNLIKNGVTERELQKAKNKVLVSYYREMETINGKASQLGNAEIYLGDWRQAFQQADRYKAVKPADIARVLKTYFVRSNRTVGILDQTQEIESK